MVTGVDVLDAGTAAACLSCAQWAGLGPAEAAALLLVASAAGRALAEYALRRRAARAGQKVSNQVSSQS